MLTFRNAAIAALCDGCFSLMSKPGDVAEGAAAAHAYRTADGRDGHVCSEDCAQRFEALKPLDKRQIAA